ncbi:U-box domain-containing protein 35-like [Hibiscus syriacus]|uniref:U-box domain-containing protein 35-like n=1 Tax=Hibiscus syriacus TaxID=106335 RepID=UPI001924519B|nr:U-box domain-containing protein 35-like [Hibiscus syriacus]
MSRTHSARGERGERRSDRSVAVAVDKDKYSLQALHWAIDNVLIRGQTLRLVHVLQKPICPVSPDDGGVGGDRQVDNQNMDFLLRLRSLCARKHIQCETVVLEDSDVAKALIGYIHQYEIETLFVGAASKTGISRLFKGTNVPSIILKLAPNFCNVYVISRRKVAAARTATRSVPRRTQSWNDLATSDT